MASAIKQHLSKGEKVLWLASGGSGIKVGLKTLEMLNGIDLENLTITLTDERYGELGHKDENWQQLLGGGADFKNAKTFRIIKDLSFNETTENFNDWLEQTIENVDFVIGLFGIGADGHTAGIKPNSVAATSIKLADNFTGEDFQRITITPKMFKHINQIVTQASGVDKTRVLETLFAEKIDFVDQPAQLLKTVAVSDLVTDNEVRLS